eukprot:gb/GECG01016450.1/.p1 GENE.gb/GECG01016450.1/~~gb/GECG01016450.1/.p1  ORF type:complete len:522 (+),score=52.98 gb/GECG01016450.1/:1-1566(+)
MPKRRRESSSEDEPAPPRIQHPPELPDSYEIDISRVRVMNGIHDVASGSSSTSSKRDGPVIYWMSRDQRSADNWALLYAQARATEHQRPLVVAFNVVNGFLGATLRQFDFMIQGLKEVDQNLEEKNIRFVLTRGEVEKSLPLLANKVNACLVVCDFSPLRIGVQWRSGIASELAKAGVPFHEVDAHNIVPCWYASDKVEYAARTIRRKLHSQLPQYLTDFPGLLKHGYPCDRSIPKYAVEEDGKLVLHDVTTIDWDSVLSKLDIDRNVKPLKWIHSGEKAGHEMLTKFCSNLKGYDTVRNDPTKDNLSKLSPYFHFGQLSPQRACYDVDRYAKKNSSVRKAADAFLEEAIVRRELSDNYCFYNQQYDSLWKLYPHAKGTSWALETLKKHSSDERPYVYSLEKLESGDTHDDLWNAAQKEMVYLGKMHGFLRMYWAKKILEWTESPETAHRYAVYLNDKYEIDGRDPNGYVGVNWAIAGIHDQGWTERAIFGKVRYMNYQGCKRKFDIQAYVRKIHKLIRKG